MRYSLAAMTRRTRNPRRSAIPIRPIQAPAARATDLYQTAYAPIIAAWSAGLEPILAEYERTLAELTTDSPANAGARVSAVEAQAAAVLVTLRIRIEAWAKRLAAWHAARWRANVVAATGVELGAMIGPADNRMTVEASVERNAGLVRSVSDQARQRIADSVFRGFQRKAPAREIAAELREALAMARRRALLIASDQTVKLAAALNEERRRQAGIDSFVWRHSGKQHPREEHKARDGKYYTEKSVRIGQEYQGQTIRAAPADRAGFLPYCGCTEQALLVLD